MFVDRPCWIAEGAMAYWRLETNSSFRAKNREVVVSLYERGMDLKCADEMHSLGTFTDTKTLFNNSDISMKVW